MSNMDDLNRELQERSAVWMSRQNKDDPPEVDHIDQKRDGLLERLARWVKRLQRPS
jgi:hypothetical protein